MEEKIISPTLAVVGRSEIWHAYGVRQGNLVAEMALVCWDDHEIPKLKICVHRTFQTFTRKVFMKKIPKGSFVLAWK